MLFKLQREKNLVYWKITEVTSIFFDFVSEQNKKKIRIFLLEKWVWQALWSYEWQTWKHKRQISQNIFFFFKYLS